MAGSRRGPPSRNKHSTGSRRSPDDIKEKLKASLQETDSKSFSLEAVRDACKEAGLDDATAARVNDMALYAAYAMNASVRKSGQSAFTWIPLQGVAQSALQSVPTDARADFAQRFIPAVTGVLKHIEEQDSLDDIEGPPDLSEGSKLIHNVIVSLNKMQELLEV